jgi:hypothetical protein
MAEVVTGSADFAATATLVLAAWLSDSMAFVAYSVSESAISINAGAFELQAANPPEATTPMHETRKSIVFIAVSSKNTALFVEKVRSGALFPSHI